MTANPLRLQDYLDGLDYPVSKEDLIRRAQEGGADTELLQTLRSLAPEQFNSPTEVSGALGELT